jgi:hypothetical protein
MNYLARFQGSYYTIYMSLTQEDLQAIRGIVREEATSIIVEKLRPIEVKIDILTGKVTALENDVKDIYRILAHHRMTAPS